jgi:hypothetical protein
MTLSAPIRVIMAAIQQRTSPSAVEAAPDQGDRMVATAPSVVGAATPQRPCGDLGELDDRQQAKLVEIVNHQPTDWSFHSHPYRGLAGTLKVAQLVAL